MARKIEERYTSPEKDACDTTICTVFDSHLSRLVPVPYLFHTTISSHLHVILVRPKDQHFAFSTPHRKQYMVQGSRSPTDPHSLFIPSPPPDHPAEHSFRVIPTVPIMFFVQRKYLLVVFSALCVRSAQSQCQLANDCNECLNKVKPLGDRCTASTYK